MENSNVTGKVIGAILVGTILGGAIGLLFAPYKGSRTRNRIARRSKDLTKDLTNKMKKEGNILLIKAEKLERLAEEKIQNLTNKVKEKVDSYKYQNEKNEKNNI